MAMTSDPPEGQHDRVSGLPRLIDGRGYVAKPRDLAFAEISSADAQAMAHRVKPLGFASPELWQACREELRDALRQAGIGNADVRLKGSASEFFSRNPDKRFPSSVAECRSLAAMNGLPEEDAEARWQQSPYAAAVEMPGQCFWDCRFHLGLEDERSDYDFQLSSDQLVEMIETAYPSGKLQGRPIKSEHGGHFKDAVLKRVVPRLADWSDRWQEVLGRKINLAGFPGAGPAREISRFSNEDWVII